jgi:hypothetical protein
MDSWQQMVLQRAGSTRGWQLHKDTATTRSKDEDHSLVKLRQTSISLYQNINLCHICNPKGLPTTNIELHPKSEPVTTQQNFVPEFFNTYTYTSCYIYYILINFNILQFNNLTYNIDIL